MKRPWRTVLVWSIALAAGGAWWALHGRSAVVAAEEASVPVFTASDAIPVDSIDRIDLTRAGAPPMVFRRTGGQWSQTEPFVADLDAWSARQLIVELAGLAASPWVGEAADRSAFGLEPPVAAVTLRAGDRTWALDFGKRRVAGRAYVARPGGPPLVADAGAYERVVETDPKEWRSRALFPDSMGRPQRFVWRYPSNARGTPAVIELARDGDRWSVVAPIKARADSPHIEEFIAGMTRARSEGFLADQPSELGPTYGLAPAAVTMAVTTEGERGPSTRTLLIGSQLGVGTIDRYGMIEGQPSVVRVGANTLALLFPRLETLVDPVASGARAADVKRIEIRRQGGSIELTRELDQWTASLDGGAAVAAPAAAAERLLLALTRERAGELSIGEFPANLEVATVLLYGFDGRPLDVVRVAREEKTSKWGLENGDTVVRIHPSTFVLPLEPGAFGL